MQLWSWTRDNTLHYILICNLYFDLRTELLHDNCTLNPTLKNLSHEKLLNILLYGSEGFSFKTSEKIIKSTIEILKFSERFSGPLFWPFTQQRKLNEKRPFLRLYLYICMPHLNACALWLVSVLGSVSCRFYSLVVNAWFFCFFLFFCFLSVFM